METNELLQHAREAFIKEFAQTPEELGYLEANVYKSKVMFSKSKEIFEAFSNAQDLIRKSINQFIGLLILIISLTVVILLTGVSNHLALMHGAVGTVIAICLFTAVINYRRYHKCNSWEALYQKEGNSLMYDGKIFYALHPQPVHPETAFF